MYVQIRTQKTHTRNMRTQAYSHTLERTRHTQTQENVNDG